MDLLERLPDLPDSGGVSTLLRVTMSLDKLKRGVGAAQLDTGGHMSAGQFRRLACNARIIPVVLGGKSEPLDVGRARRLHTAAMREGMEVRDGGCVAEGCTFPAAWTEAHHEKPWSAGGVTSLDNGFLLCSYHHRLIHHSRWRTTWAGGELRFRKVEHA
jgi:hypothetical protein